MMDKPHVEIKVSATVAINSIVQMKVNAGMTVYNLGAGEPILPVHPSIQESMTQHVTEDYVLYPPVSGLPALREFAINWMNQTYGTHFQRENCLVVNGGKFGIFLLLKQLLTNGEQVLINAPYWVSYPTITELCNGETVIIPTTAAEGWKLTPRALRAACTGKSKVLILNNACNPTGVLYSEPELLTLLQIAAEHDLWVISDEVYSGLTYDGHEYISCGKFLEFRDRVVIIQSCSKHFAMTGWRVGFVFGPSALMEQITVLLGQSTTGVAVPCQWAALTAVQHADVITRWVRQTMQTRRNLSIEAFSTYFGINIPPPPSGLYLFIALSDLGIHRQTANEFCLRAMDEAQIALVPGDAFGQSGYLRLSFGGKQEEIIKGIELLSNFCETLR